MNRSVIIAITIAVGVTGWIISGQFSRDTAEPSSDKGSESATLPPALEPKTVAPLEVQVRTFIASERTQEVVVRGKTEAFRTVELKAEIPGRVVEVLAERGQRVKEGDILVKFAVKARLAQLAEAEALVRQREIEYTAAKSLNKKGFSAATTLASSKALLDSALAKAKSVRIMLEDLIIRAPFDGIVEERHVEIGDYLKDSSAPLCRALTTSSSSALRK